MTNKNTQTAQKPAHTATAPPPRQTPLQKMGAKAHAQRTAHMDTCIKMFEKHEKEMREHITKDIGKWIGKRNIRSMPELVKLLKARALVNTAPNNTKDGIDDAIRAMRTKVGQEIFKEFIDMTQEILNDEWSMQTDIDEIEYYCHPYGDRYLMPDLDGMPPELADDKRASDIYKEACEKILPTVITGAFDAAKEPLCMPLAYYGGGGTAGEKETTNASD